MSATVLLVLTGTAAGIALGYVLQRSQLCFHATFSRLYERRTQLFRGWLLGVAGASVGLAVLFTLPLAADLNRGLPLVPVANVTGGLLIGAGMAVARSCVSGLFYKLGAGMLGALVGLVGWGAGEVVARQVPRPGPVVLPGGDAATIPGLLGVPRLLVAVLFLVGVAVFLRRWRTGRTEDAPRWQWGWQTTGLALAAATVGGWALAGLGGHSFGPSTVGAVSGAVSGSPNVWLLAFLPGLVLGAHLAARTAGGLWVRGETPVRYGQLAAGGVLLGAGGWIAGGCNLGHGLSGVAQLNVSSWLVVVSIVGGIGLVRAARGLPRRPNARTPS